MKIFRLTAAELKKIFLRPSIFIMIGLLVIVSFISLLTFSPVPRKNVQIEIKGNTVSEIYAKFNSANENDINKITFDKILENKKNEILSFLVPDLSLSDMQTYFNSTVKVKYEQMYRAIEKSNESSFNGDECNKTIGEYKQIVSELSNKIKTSLFNSKKYYINKQDYEKALAVIDKHISILPTYNLPQDKVIYLNLLKTLRKNDFITTFENSIKPFKKIDVEKDAINKIVSTYHAPAILALNDINKKIDKFYLDNAASKKDEHKSNMNFLISIYKSTINMAEENLDSSLNIVLAKDNSDMFMQGLLCFNNFNRIQYNSVLKKNAYLINNKEYDINYLNSLSAGLDSGMKTNAYDFVAYSNEIVSILIVIFSILIASKLIAGEQSNGTMKLLAIRPYSRTKIIFGKLFATIFFAAIFMLFATICNLLIGIGFFGLPATSLMIGVFNGTSVFVSHPIVFLIFSTFSIFLKIIMFTSIAVLISVLFKSYTGAAFSSFIIYILTFGLNFLLKGTSWYKFFPTANFDLYKYFIPLQQTADPTLANIIYPLFNDANFFLTLGIFLGTLLIIQLISIITFKRKDIA